MNLVADFRVIGHHDFFADGVEHGAAQLPAVALVARFAGRARVDHQHLADAAHQLVVGVAVQHEIRFGLAEPRQLGVVRVDVSPLRLPRGRVDEEQLLSADIEFEPFGPLGEPLEQRAVDPVGLARAGAMRAEKALLVVAENGMGAAVPQQALRPRSKSGIRRCCRRGKSARRHRRVVPMPAASRCDCSARPRRCRSSRLAPARDDVHRLQAHDDVSVLVQHLDQGAHHAAVGF